MAAFLDGVRRVVRAPLVVAGVYVVVLISAVGLDLVEPASVGWNLATPAVGDTASSMAETTWLEVLDARSRSVVQTFEPRIIGFAAVLGDLSHRDDRDTSNGSVLMPVLAYVVVWAFLIGGLLDRLARQRRVGSVGFLAAGGRSAFRLGRLAVIAGCVYLLVFAVRAWVDAAISTSGVKIGLYILWGAVLLVINLVFDYAAVRTVIEDRRSVVGSCLAAGRFVRRRPREVVGLYALNGGIFLLLVVGYAVVAPDVANGPWPWVNRFFFHASVVAGLFAQLVSYASQTAYFQQELAHATYVAAPPPAWPGRAAREAVSTTR